MVLRKLGFALTAITSLSILGGSIFLAESTSYAQSPAKVDLSDLRKDFFKANQDTKNAIAPDKAQADIDELAAREAKILEALKNGAPKNSLQTGNDFDSKPPQVISASEIRQLPDPRAQIGPKITNQDIAPKNNSVKIKNERDGLSSKLKTTTKKLDSARSEKERLASKLSKRDSEISSLKSQLKKTRDRLMVAESQVERLSEIVDDQNKEHISRFSPSSSRIEKRPTRTTKPAPINHGIADMEIVTVAVSKAFLRAGPGKTNSPLMTVSRGTRLTVERKKGEWFRVIAPSGVRAWISNEVIAFGNLPTAQRRR